MGIINKLTIKHILKNKKRTLVTLIAVILVSTLLFSLGLAYGTYQINEIKNVKTQEDYDAVITDIPYEKHIVFDNDNNIDEYITMTKLYDSHFDIEVFGDVKEDEDLIIYSISDNYNLKLLKGRMPNKDEIITSNFVAQSLNIDVGDSINLNVKDLDGNNINKTYKLVGIINESKPMTYKASNYYLYTKEDNSNNSYFFVYLKSKKDAYNKLFQISEKLNLKKINYPEQGYENLYPNNRLLELYGNYNDSVSYAMVYVSLIIILTILSIACTAIIYNSFAISLTERKKQFGILKSVGATNSQIRKLVFKEAIFVSVIGIPLGFLLSYISVNTILSSINKIQSGLGNTWEVAVYPSFILISLIFILLTILYSALFPALRASEITPIQAIRKSKDIKSKHKNKKHPIISKLFGVTGLIAYNNIKRNKKKYRISLLAIIVSFVLFISVSVFINFFQNNYLNGVSLDDGIYFSVSGEDEEELKKVTNELVSLDNVTDYITYQSKWVYFDNIEGTLTEEYKKSYDTEKIEITNAFLLDDIHYQKLKKANNSDLIYINYFKNIKYDDNERFISNSTGKIFKDNFKAQICAYTQEHDSNNCIGKYEIKVIDIPSDFKQFNLNNALIVNKEIFDSIVDRYGVDNEIVTLLKADNYLEIDEKIDNIIANGSHSLSWSYNNYGKDNYSTYATIQSTKVIIYSLIVLFTLIAVTSIVNTISTNMNLRRSEFAVLKSVGLDNKQFNKMLIQEGIFLSIKSLIFAIPLSLIIIKVIADLFSIGTYKYKFSYMFPTTYFIFAIVMVFVTIILTIIISTRKTKKENIVESIKEENI